MGKTMDGEGDRAGQNIATWAGQTLLCLLGDHEKEPVGKSRRWSQPYVAGTERRSRASRYYPNPWASVMTMFP